jgi:Flp pilus assembly protein TadD
VQWKSDALVDERPLVELLRARLAPVTELAPALSASDAAEIEALRQGHLDSIAAEPSMRQALALDPTREAARMQTLFEEALRACPDHQVARRCLADTLVYQGRYAEALDLYTEVARARPDDFRAHRGAGSSLTQLGRYDEAAVHLREAVALRPDDADSHNNLGVVLGQLGDHAGALHHFEEALRRKPDDANARTNARRARLAVESGG